MKGIWGINQLSNVKDPSRWAEKGLKGKIESSKYTVRIMIQTMNHKLLSLINPNSAENQRRADSKVNFFFI
jgi:hypothetical protein